MVRANGANPRRVCAISTRGITAVTRSAGMGSFAGLRVTHTKETMRMTSVMDLDECSGRMGARTRDNGCAESSTDGAK